MPISWLPWGPEAFARAQAERKPVLLSIGATWCHWCHVQERTVFSNPAIAEKVAERVISVRVDTDRRPDVNERYNQGGWPTTVFLTPTGIPITGGTYIPPEQFAEILDQLALLYPALAPTELPVPVESIAGAVEPRIVDWVGEKLKLGFDNDYGGWGFGQKFPMTEALHFLLDRHDATNELTWLELCLKSLEGLHRLFDPEAGGYFRYAVERDWSAPHYEKMLETNAELLSVLARAYKRSKETALRTAMDKTVAYLTSTLARPEGGFWGSQDSGNEAVYYRLSFAERAAHPAPSVDRTVYIDWNGLALSGLSAVWESTKDVRAKAAVEQTVPFLLSCWSEDGFAHALGAEPSTRGLLLDNVHAGRGLLDAAQALPKPEWLAHARLAGDLLLARFRTAKGAFRDRLPQADDAGLLTQERTPFLGNARAAQFLLALAKATGEQRYAEAARAALAQFAGSYLRYGILSAEYGRAVAAALA